MPVINQVFLAFQQGSSDKVYNAQIVEENGSYSVLFQYGRRGSSLKPGNKGTGLTEVESRLVFQKLIDKELRKGYQPVGGNSDATIYSAAPDEERRSGVLPQLLNTIDESRLEQLLGDDDYILQEKKDGKRIMIRKDAAGTVAINRKGLIVSIPQRIIDEVNRIPRAITLDGELIGDSWYTFDIISYGDSSAEGVKNTGFGQRLAALLKIAANLNWGVNGTEYSKRMPVIVVPGFGTTNEKRIALEAIRLAGGEGVVFKLQSSLYTPGRPNSGGPQLKYKFTATATCFVSAQEKGKRSVYLTVREPGNFGGRSVGKVTILPNFDIPQAGSLVDVRYLYAYPNGSLYQPVYFGVRDDLDQPDEYSSLKFKQGNDDNDEE